MATYSELMAQAQALMAQAEQARKDELSGVIADIKSKMKQYGLTVADLGGAAAGGTRKPAKSKSAAPAKYRGPNGELWAGGPGRKPEWVRAVLAAGKSVEDYRI
ncbi:MAG: H-NS family nucleoid-associated regulatory protein [Hydrogenophaga sp.]